MNDQDKSKDELINELKELQQKYISLETLYNKEISGRKLTGETVRSKNDRFQSIFNSLQDSFFQADLLGNFILISPSSLLMYGYKSLEEMMAVPAADLYANELERESFLKELSKKGVVRDYIGQAKRKDGSTFWVSMNAQYTMNNGIICGIEGLVRDITERKQAEAELIKAKEKAEESEFRFRSIVENTEAGYFFIDNDGLFQSVNMAWLKHYKYNSFDEVIGKHFRVVQQLEDIESAEAFVNGIRAGDPHFMIGDFSRKCKDGSLGYHTFSARPVFVDNKIEGIEGFIIDTTKQREFEQELLVAKEKAEKSEVKYHSMFSAMQEGVYLHEMIYDKEGKAVNYRIVEANAASERYLNIKREDALGKLATDLFRTDEAPFLGVYARVTETGVPTTFEQYFQPMDKHFLISVFSPQKGEFATIFQDITDKKLYELDLLDAKEKAKESDKLKSAFLANMSHEIRTPMNGILGFSNLLSEPGLGSEEQQAYIEIIQKSGARMLNILSEIIEISKIESGAMDVNIKEVNVNNSLESVYELFQPEAEIKSLTLSCKNSFQVTEPIIQTDGQKLYSILTNLVKNAIKYTDQGSIEFGCNPVEINGRNILQFYVKDTGIGIQEDRLEAIFERFIQADIVDIQARQGAGLGLAIVKSYVEMLGGRVWVESEKRIGSTFYFTLPYHPEPKGKIIVQNDLPSNKADSQINPKISGLKILIVDDDETSRIYLSIIIKNISNKVLFASSGIEAVKICQSNADLNLVLMDIQMPEMNGYEATQQIRKFNKEVIIAAQTAFAMAGDLEKAIEAGCNDYISKPIKKYEIVALIQKYFKKLM